MGCDRSMSACAKLRSAPHYDSGLGRIVISALHPAAFFLTWILKGVVPREYNIAINIFKGFLAKTFICRLNSSDSLVLPCQLFNITVQIVKTRFAGDSILTLSLTINEGCLRVLKERATDIILSISKVPEHIFQKRFSEPGAHLKWVLSFS